MKHFFQLHRVLFGRHIFKCYYCELEVTVFWEPEGIYARREDLPECNKGFDLWLKREMSIGLERHLRSEGFPPVRMRRT